MSTTADRVLESTTTTGTGNLTLAGASTGFRSFNAAFGTGVPCWYAIDSDGGAEWEVGVGQLSSSTVFVRTTVLASSNAGSAVNLSAGTKRVFATLPGSAMSAAGLALLVAANSSAQRTTLGLGSAAVESAAAFDTAGSAAAAQAAAIAASQPLDSDLTAIAALTTTSTGRSLLAAADAAAIRTIAGAETAGAAAAAQAASQPLDSDLTSIAALTTTSYGRALLELADAAALRTAVGSASTTQSGLVELLTQNELDTATDSTRAPTANILRVSMHALAASF
jgi:hypothetical protein